MADEPDQYPGDASGHMRPELTQFVDQFQGQPWAAAAAGKVQDYLTTKQIAQNAQDAGQRLVQNIGQTKNNLVSMVKNDPGSASLALGLVPDMIDGLTAEHGHAPGTHAPLVSDMQREIAHNAITSLAGRNPDAARAALKGDLGGYLADSDHAGLGTFIDNQEQFINQDNAARSQQLDRDQSQASYSKASTYLNSMVHPQTGDVYMPPGLGVAVMNDPAVATSTRAAVHDVYTRMANGQRLGTSDPMVLTSLVNRMADPTAMVGQDELMHHIGTNLSLQDGVHLNAMLDPSLDMGSKQQVKALANTLNSAQSQIASPMNGPAGRAAYGRFTNWLMPALRGGGNLNDLLQGNRLQQFAPTGDDAMAGIRMAQGPMRGEALGWSAYPVDPGQRTYREDQTEQAPSRQGSFNPDIDRAGEHKPGETSDQFQHGGGEAPWENPRPGGGANGVKAGTSMSPQQGGPARNIGT